MENQIFDRAAGRLYTEKQYGADALEFLYESPFGRLCLNGVIKTRLFSRLHGVLMKSRLSAKKIGPFIREYGIVMEDCQPAHYRCYNDFFTRRVRMDRRPFSRSGEALVSPADAKLLAYSINPGLRLCIKGSDYTLGELLRDEKLALDYQGGCCLVFRLTVDDCHRYLYVDDGEVTGQRSIPGCLHTVGPYSDGRQPVLRQNYRQLTGLRTEHLGQVLQLEVGALLVGEIVNHPVKAFKKGEEKGYFSFGGSTILLLLQRNRIALDDDILEHSGQGVETKIKMGETIGRCLA